MGVQDVLAPLRAKVRVISRLNFAAIVPADPDQFLPYMQDFNSDTNEWLNFFDQDINALTRKYNRCGRYYCDRSLFDVTGGRAAECFVHMARFVGEVKKFNESYLKEIRRKEEQIKRMEHMRIHKKRMEEARAKRKHKKKEEKKEMELIKVREEIFSKR